MNEESNEEVTREIHIDDENFINTLSQVRKRQSSAEQEEIQELAQRLAGLQQKLAQMKDSINREKTIHELDILNGILSNCLYATKDRVDILEIQEPANKNIKTVLKAYEMILKREFGEFEG